MQFYPWFTAYDEYKASCKANRRQKLDSIETFNFKRKRDLEEYALRGFPRSSVDVQQDRLLIEEKWRQSGSPYYNVHPSLVEKFCHVNLSKIPAKLVEMPNEYRAVVIKFGQQHDELTLHGCSALGVPEGSYIKSVLMTRGFNALRHCEVREGFTESLYCLLNFNSTPGGLGEPNQLIVLPVWFRGNDSLEAALKNFIANRNSLPNCLPLPSTAMDLLRADANDNRQNKDNIDTVDLSVLKIIVTIGFLANSNDQLIEPDVLSKLRNAYTNGTKQARKDIAAKSRRKGKLGYNVGNDMMFLGAKPFQKRENYDSSDKELEYAHIRGGHPHAVRYGKGHEKVKIMWFRPLTVRADLPFKPDKKAR